jgi:hypothetical protein
MGFTVYVASDASSGNHRSIYGGNPDEAQAIEMCKEAVAKKVAGPTTFSFVVDNDVKDFILALVFKASAAASQ